MKKTLLMLAALLAIHCSYAQPAKHYDIIGYYSGDGKALSAYPIEKLTQLIFSFLHLKGNELAFDNEQRKQDLLQIVALKNKRNPSMKVLISLGGWGGCATCSPVFATAENRQAFPTPYCKFCKPPKQMALIWIGNIPLFQAHPAIRTALMTKQILRISFSDYGKRWATNTN